MMLDMSHSSEKYASQVQRDPYLASKGNGAAGGVGSISSAAIVTSPKHSRGATTLIAA